MASITPMPSITSMVSVASMKSTASMALIASMASIASMDSMASIASMAPIASIAPVLGQAQADHPGIECWKETCDLVHDRTADEVHNKNQEASSQDREGRRWLEGRLTPRLLLGLNLCRALP